MQKFMYFGYRKIVQASLLWIFFMVLAGCTDSIDGVEKASYQIKLCLKKNVDAKFKAQYGNIKFADADEARQALYWIGEFTKLCPEEKVLLEIAKNEARIDGKSATQISLAEKNAQMKFKMKYPESDLMINSQY